jgi:L-amino acid N-acyltransferase YncA
MGGPRGAAGVTLRDGRAADAAAIAAVHVASWRAAYPGLLPAAVLADLSVEHRTATWERVLADRRHFVVVAERDGCVTGVGHAGPARDADVGSTTGQLTTLYLAPGTWGAGTGRALHDAALGCLVAAGYDSAVVWMLSTNDRARRFYERQGWGRDRVLRVQQFGGRVVIDHRFARRLGPGTSPGRDRAADRQIFSRPSQ